MADATKTKSAAVVAKKKSCRSCCEKSQADIEKKNKKAGKSKKTRKERSKSMQDKAKTKKETGNVKSKTKKSKKVKIQEPVQAAE